MTTILTCRAQHCRGIADDARGWCAAHRSALTLTVKFQDAVREFLLLPSGSVLPTQENAESVIEAGKHLAHGLALLIGTKLEDVEFEASAIYLDDLSASVRTPWRVSFDWQAGGNDQSWCGSDELEADDQP